MFESRFRALTGYAPLGWQRRWYAHLVAGEFDRIATTVLPTGLGKTSVIVLWLLAFAANRSQVPRRLVYVVNRRTVVDQTTVEAERLRTEIAAKAVDLGIPELAISTLRGQFADNREWSADPARPAMIAGTVDMIGSRLLFSGYGCGFKAKPMHAGFLAQDVLLVHDEAHLEAPFQCLIEDLRAEQQRCGDRFKFETVELTATARAERPGFCLLAEEHQEPIVKQRVSATKQLEFHQQLDPAKLAVQLARLALEHRASGRAILIFVQLVEDVEKVRELLDKELKSDGKQIKTLTGTMRGLERDALVLAPVFQRFLPSGNRTTEAADEEKTVYLICTSAGEVGINISADHLICDLSTYESMAQRFGRVNRFGERNDTRIDIVFPAKFDPKDVLSPAKQITLELLQQLNGDGSPHALSKLGADKVKAAFSPPPEIIPTSEILFDSWSLTTLQESLPGRPPVADFLHGVREWEPPQTQVAWRREVELLTRSKEDNVELWEELLTEYPLKPHELLRDRTDRVFKHLTLIARRHPTAWAWLLDEEGHLEIRTLTELADKDRKEQLEGRTLLLSPSVGGLSDGILDGNSVDANDVADEWWRDEKGKLLQRRLRLWSDAADYYTTTKNMRRIRKVEIAPIDISTDADEAPSEDAAPRTWDLYELPLAADNDGSSSNVAAVLLTDHVDQVTANVVKNANDLALPAELVTALELAAQYHDQGKARVAWQRSIGNRNPAGPQWFAKSARDWQPGPQISYRHEFGSLLDISANPTFQALPEPLRDLVLHLIAAHHGRGRPHFPAAEVFDPEQADERCQQLAGEVPLRFARLQRKYGRWGLAYLESLLRAADYAASAAPIRSEIAQ